MNSQTAHEARTWLRNAISVERDADQFEAQFAQILTQGIENKQTETRLRASAWLAEALETVAEAEAYDRLFCRVFAGASHH